jgi:S1-C subfamily serine protease
VIAAAISGTRYPRARIGIEVPTTQHVEVTPELAAERNLPVEAGALIIAPAANSPAARAGIEAGDIVIGVNGVAIDLDTPFVNLLKALPAGARPNLAILRDGRHQAVTVTPEP